MGNPITVSSDSTEDLSRSAYDHLWMHFTRMSSYENAPVPTIVRGEGTHIYDDKGRRYLDGLAHAVIAAGGHIYERSAVDEFSGEPLGATANGFAVTADDVVIATHNPLAGLSSLPVATVLPVAISTRR